MAEQKKSIYAEELNKALIFAANAHMNADRKSTDIPYILHPMEVATIVMGMMDSLGKPFSEYKHAVYAALLHDTIEDAHKTKDEIIKDFGNDVADIVAAESENKREEQSAESTWEQRKQETINHLNSLNSKADYYVKLVAFADKLANLRAIAHDYRAIGEEVWKRFNQNNSERICWYYTSVYQACKTFEPCREYKEYGELLREIFIEKIHIGK